MGARREKESRVIEREGEGPRGQIDHKIEPKWRRELEQGQGIHFHMHTPAFSHAH